MKTSVEWLQDKLNNVKPTEFCSIETIKKWVEQAKEMHDYANNSEAKWISVEDRLPENDNEVLIICSGEVVQAYLKNGIWKGSVQVTYNMNDGYVNDRNICKQGKSNPFDNVTHWMPLPTPPNQ